MKSTDARALYKSAFINVNGYEPDAAELDSFERLYKSSPALQNKVAETVQKIEIMKRAAAPKEKTVVEKKLGEGLFADKISEPGTSKSVKEFMPGTDGMSSVDPDAVANLLDSMSGRGTESEEMFSPAGAAKFPTTPAPSAGDGHGAEATPFPKPYDVVHPGSVAVKVGPNFILAPMDPNIAPSAAFDAPEPGRESTNPGGSSPVFKTAEQHGVRKGTFASIVKPEAGDLQYGSR